MMKYWLHGMLALGLVAVMVSCGNSEGDDTGPTGVMGAYVVLAWNDLGMHCLNPTYDEAVILPPYNTVWAQVIKRGNPPEIVTDNLTLAYEIVNNTYSYGKTDNLGGDYAQFWDNVVDLFGVSLDHDKGLNLREPDIHNGLSGTMRTSGDHFQVDGIPLTPVDDDGVWNPYQVISVTVRDTAGNQLAATTTTAPTSDEINCGKCHGANAFADIISKHDTAHGTTLAASKPVLCAGCHGSPALGSADGGTAGYLSKAIHGFHASKGAACQDCHPGEQTKCNRSLAHTAADGNCTACHGTMAQVASGIPDSRIPWVNEPACSDCHGATIPQVNTGDTLYRNATGHGGLYCATCHGSPHAMLPSREASDNAQAIALQNKAKTIGSCAVCHSSSKGPSDDKRKIAPAFESGEFGEVHGGENPEHRNACHVCHTAVPTTTSHWPHGFQWKSR